MGRNDENGQTRKKGTTPRRISMSSTGENQERTTRSMEMWLSRKEHVPRSFCSIDLDILFFTIPSENFSSKNSEFTNRNIIDDSTGIDCKV